MSSTFDALSRSATQLAERASQRGIVMRVLGGVAVRMRLTTTRAAYEEQRSVPKDIDLLTNRAAGKSLIPLFSDLGYDPDRRFIAWQGAARHLYHRETETGCFDVDVFLDVPPTCHQIDVSAALRAGQEPALEPTLLFLLKLQIVKLNEKDLVDMAFLLEECDLTPDTGPDASHLVSAGHIAKLLSNDWGFWYTANENLSRLVTFATKRGLELAARRADALRREIELVEKSRRWRMRAKIGTRMQWYEDLEDVVR